MDEKAKNAALSPLLTIQTARISPTIGDADVLNLCHAVRDVVSPYLWEPETNMFQTSLKVNEQDLSRYAFDQPAAFRLRVLGYMSQTWADELGDGVIEHAQITETLWITIVTARFTDQAALIGSVNRLYGLGFPLISVECMEIG